MANETESLRPNDIRAKLLDVASQSLVFTYGAGSDAVYAFARSAALVFDIEPDSFIRDVETKREELERAYEEYELEG